MQSQLIIDNLKQIIAEKDFKFYCDHGNDIKKFAANYCIDIRCNNDRLLE